MEPHSMNESEVTELVEFYKTKIGQFVKLTYNYGLSTMLTRGELVAIIGRNLILKNLTADKNTFLISVASILSIKFEQVDTNRKRHDIKPPISDGGK